MFRYRNLRRNPAVRALVRETVVTKDDLIMPFFVMDGENAKQDIPSMPGIRRYTVDRLMNEVEFFVKNGGRACLLFGVPSKKDAKASAAYAKDAVVCRAIKAIKKDFPGLVVMTDVCLCAYMDHGHCGVLRDDGVVDNDASLPLLGNMAEAHAAAGADFVAPSDMMDFRVEWIRNQLDERGFGDVSILSYAVKYASAYYGPFRDACDSTPESGDRRSYQMDPANKREAVKEAKQDILEGADIIMVKPALAYLDILSTLRQEITMPLAAYNVSGEYAMVKAAAEKGWIDEQGVVMETMTAMKRAGADLIITYFAKDILGWIQDK